MSHSKHNNIDGFFRSPRPASRPEPRPGLDSLPPRGQRASSGVQRLPASNLPPTQQWQPRRSPAKPKLNDYFREVPPAYASQSAGSIPATPAPLRGHRRPGQKESRRPDWLRRPSKRTVKRTGLVALAVLLIIGGYLLVKFLIASAQIFQGNLFGALFSQQLQVDENGRSNILVFGTSEDDPAHPGAELTDSMMILSVDQKTKKAFMVSVPRDLYVDYGTACSAGYEGKINNVYLCAKGQNGGSEKAGQRALRKKVGDVFGMDVQYSAHINYTALKQVVDAVGGITVEIDSDDPRGILDRNFDWLCDYECYYVKHDNGPVRLDGAHALALARARGSTPPTYGLSGGNFDREKYQRKILLAIKEKAVSAGTLTNPVKISSLIDALGKNVRTNFETGEIKTLVNLAQEINPNDIRSLSLVDPEDPLVTTGNIGGASIVQPSAGLYEYGDIYAAIDAHATGDTAYFEHAVADVLNASGEAGAAGETADQLSNAGIIVEIVGNAPESLDTSSVQLYDLSGGEKPDTRKKLKKLLNVQSVRTELPSGVTSSSDFVIIVGSDGA